MRLFSHNRRDRFQWLPWFAWRPVRVETSRDSYDVVWLQRVMRFQSTMGWVDGNFGFRTYNYIYPRAKGEE
jgi:hypothetical protein